MIRQLLFVVLASLATVQAQGNSVCAKWCKANFPQPGSVCTDPASLFEGPCYDCGPLKTNPAAQLCAGACVNTSNDNANCGSCGNACSSDKFCSEGVCKTKACTNTFVCGGPPTNCPGVGGLCVCFASNGGSGEGNCLDVTQLGGCPPSRCTADADCGSGSVCVSSCCGRTCATTNARCPAATPSRIFRRESIEASSPWLNPSVDGSQ